MMNFWEVVCTSIIVYLAILMAFHLNTWQQLFYNAINDFLFPVRVLLIRTRTFLRICAMRVRVYSCALFFLLKLIPLKIEKIILRIHLKVIQRRIRILEETMGMSDG